MNTDKNTRTIILGFFILIALVIFALGLFVLSGRQKTFGKTIHVKSIFTNVNGLKKGSNVLFGGVKVGVVQSLSLQSGNKVLVEMQIENEAQKFIPKDATVSVGSDGLIGNKVLEISEGNLQLGYVQNGDTLSSGQSTSLEEMFKTLQVNNKNLLEITDNLKQISRKVLNGEGLAGKLISDDALVDNVQALLRKLHTSADNAQTLTRDVAAFTAKLEKPGTMTYNLVNDTSIFNRLHAISRRLETMVDNAQKMVTKLDAAADKLQDTDKPAGMILNDKTTADELKKIINSLQTGTEKLNETFEALRYNFFLRGSFKKMDKNKDSEK
jgi:phospholipid/cholesterol/gamma-HCH transport system substrate-binding protein